MLKALLPGRTKQPVNPAYLEPHLFLAIFKFQKLNFPNAPKTGAVKHNICSKISGLITTKDNTLTYMMKFTEHYLIWPSCINTMIPMMFLPVV
jgi:hypothetical protein